VLLCWRPGSWRLHSLAAQPPGRQRKTPTSPRDPVCVRRRPGLCPASVSQAGWLRGAHAQH
jgi:hypothetical protein